MANQNALIGMDTERLFKNSIGNQAVVLNTLKEHFGIKGDLSKSFSTGTDSGKSDVMVRFTDSTLSANIKAYKTGFNQLTRTTISLFCKEFNITIYRASLRKGQFV